MANSLHSKRAADIGQRMENVGIREKDIQEKFILSSGPGGQNVNKVATCVVLLHGPSGIRVKESSYRTQAANRVRAREVLVEKMESKAAAQKRSFATARFKEQARQRRRSKKMKERMLENKRFRSERKQTRKRISGAGVDFF